MSCLYTYSKVQNSSIFTSESTHLVQKMFSCVTNVNSSSFAHPSHNPSNVRCKAQHTVMENIIKLISIQYNLIVEVTPNKIFYQYFGIFGPVTIPTTGPEWIPIRSWSRKFGTRGTLKFPEAAARSKAIDAITITCLFPRNCYKRISNFSSVLLLFLMIILSSISYCKTNPFYLVFPQRSKNRWWLLQGDWSYERWTFVSFDRG